MDERKLALLGVIGPLTAYVFIGMAIWLSPWFSWWVNALSDLGHATRSSAAYIFNFGLLLTGLLIMVFAIMVFRKYAKYTSVSLAATAFALQMVAAFNETYGFLHFEVSVLFFVLLGVSSIVYAIERRSFLSVIAFIVGLSSWALYGAKIYSGGVAIPEILSSTAALSWVVLAALKICFNKQLPSSEGSSRQSSQKNKSEKQL
jgi:hypothetical membrane protein